MALSDTACRTAKPRDKAYKLADSGGLYLFVSPSGGRLWRQKYRHGGKEKVLSFGGYPTVSLADARALSLEAKRRLQAGHDPAIAEDNKARTFKEVGDIWLKSRAAAWTPKHSLRIEKRVSRDLYPHLGTRPIDRIAAKDVLAALRPVEERGALETAKYLRRDASAIFLHAIAEGWAERDVAHDVRGAMKASPRVKHNPKLPATDLPDFFRRLREYDGDAITRLALELVLHTWVRTAEMRFATWGEIDGDVWRIPAERMKMSRDHIVPLTPQALAILEQLKAAGRGSKWVAPGVNGSMSENTLLFALYRMGYHSRLTVHGFRGTASTIANESGLWSPDWIEMQLAHVSGGVRAAYNAASYLEHRRKMLIWWSDLLDEQAAKNLTD